MRASVKGLAGATGTEKEEPNESAKTFFKLLTEDILEKVQKET